MPTEPKIFVVLRDGRPTKLFRRIRKQLVDAVIAVSQEDAMVLAMARNPLRPHERFVLMPIFETPESMKIVRELRSKRDAEIKADRELLCF